MDNFGFANQNGENGTLLDPASRTRGENYDLGENLQSMHCTVQFGKRLPEKRRGADFKKG